MQTFSKLRLLKAAFIPLLFCGVAIGVVALYGAIQRKGELPAPVARSQGVPEAVASVADLSAAAGKGDLAARLEMGRRLVLGQGVSKNDLGALSYFQGIVREFEDAGAHDDRSPYVSAAYLELARLYKQGVPEGRVESNPAQAFSFLHHAASYFGNPAAQVELAKILMSGDGVSKNPRAAAQWLLIASKKGYAPAQALLGDILWRGEGVTRVAGDGLGLLAIARHNALGDDKAWVAKLFEAARSEARPVEVLEANAFIVQEAKVSHFALTGDILIKAAPVEGAGVLSGLASMPRVDAGAPAPGSAAISGTSKALSELGATPMGLPQSLFDAELAARDKGVRPSVGIIEMYRPNSSELRDLPPVRFAGVSR
jgi:uncharacterized protein